MKNLIVPCIIAELFLMKRELLQEHKYWPKRFGMLFRRNDLLKVVSIRNQLGIIR